MKSSISKQTIYLLVLSVALLIFVLLFSFGVLIPAGKEYRQERAEVNKEMMELRRYQEFSDATLEQLKTLQGDHRDIITAFNTSFSSQKFEKLYSGYFTKLKLSELQKLPKDTEQNFAVYEVNTTSAINSPQSFYEFLDAINKGNWAISVNFPINFVREGEMISSSFSMKVYNDEKSSQK